MSLFKVGKQEIDMLENEEKEDYDGDPAFGSPKTGDMSK